MVIIKSKPEILKAIIENLPDLRFKDGGSCLAFNGNSLELQEKLSRLDLTADVLLDIYENGEAKKETIPCTMDMEPIFDDPDPEVQNEPANIEPAEKSKTVIPIEAVETEEKPSEDLENPASETHEPVAEAKADPEKKVIPKAKEKKITFTNAPTERELPPILPVPSTNYSYEEAIKKLSADKMRLTSNAADSLWTVDALCERCKEDHDFVQYVMREGKTFIAAYNYLAGLALEKQVGAYVENLKETSLMVELSKENALPYFIEYFMLDDDEITRRENEKRAKEKAEREAKAAKANQAKAKKGKAKKTPASAPAPAPKEDLLKEMEIPKTETPEKPVRKQESTVKEPESAIKGEQLDMFSLVGLAV